MGKTDLSRLRPVVAERLGPFVERLVQDWPENLTHLFVVGSATTTDFDERTSDINTLAVLTEVRFEGLTKLAEDGARFGKKGIAAPMLFTRRQIERSLDVFPMEFLSFRLHHECVLGDDFLAGLEIGKTELRLQCERELRRALIRINHDYLRARSERKELEGLIRAVWSGTVPVLRALLFIRDVPVPADRAGVAEAVGRTFGFDARAFAAIEEVRRKLAKPDVARLTVMCQETYNALERLTDAVDSLKI
jgi:hypothetical protein